MINNTKIARREFLKFLAASPLLSSINLANAGERNGLDPDIQYLLNLPRGLVESPDKALNIFDLEAVARHTLPPAHYGYIATGVTDERVQIANREGYHKIQLKPKRLIDVHTIDTAITLFGQRWPSPIALAPTGSHRAFHPEGEIAVARAAKSRAQLMLLSNYATTSVEDVNKARGMPVWFQIYAGYQPWLYVLERIRRVENAGCPALVMTVDTIGAGPRETLERFKKMDNRDCTACHDSPSGGGSMHRHPMYQDTRKFSLAEKRSQPFDWGLVDKVRAATDMKLLIKGIASAEDASQCLKRGVDGIIVSNHGGRAGVSVRSTIAALPEITRTVQGRIPVLIDGGIRRGSDVYKALALGADAVCIGRPYLWGLGAFGQPGVERVMDILNREFTLVMKQMGVTAIKDISRDSLAL